LRFFVAPFLSKNWAFITLGHLLYVTRRLVQLDVSISNTVKKVYDLTSMSFGQ
jgi:hypothetical protein